MDWEFLSPEERLIAEQAILNYRELSNICREAEDGHVLNVCETLALDQGRELTRKTIELILNDQAPTVEKKGARSCACGTQKRHRGKKARRVMTVAGDIKLVRTYLDCQACQQSGYPLDERLGINGRYSPRVQRLICLAAASWSYDLSSDRLEEFCGLSVSDTTIRSLAQQQGASALRWLRECPEGVKDFREARGEIEFTTDGTCVNTIEGWREMKLGIFSKRERGTPAQISEWDSRPLPVAEPRIAFAAIETSEEFGRRWKAWQKRLGIVDSSAVTVLADGAKWIWEEQRKHLVYAEGVLDIFHVLERVHETGKELHAEGSQVQAWTDQVRELLLSGGFVAVRGFLSDCQAAANGAGAQAIERLWGYLAAHGGHLNYAERLQTGRSIGSGQVEGACKNMIGRRLKANSARWRVRRVNRMAGLCSLMYSQQWETYWLAA